MQTFPGLFKLHKTRSDHGNQTRKFMLFLDREVESSLLPIAAFYSIVCSIFCSCTMVFLRYFPVEESDECLETDSHGRSLFCYSDSSLINSSLPVDCANFSVTELRELQFQCYAIALPAGLGIAVAAALGLAKVARLVVTIYVRATEAFINITKKIKLPQEVQNVDIKNFIIRLSVKLIYVLMTAIITIAASYFIFVFGLQFIQVQAETDSYVLHFLYYMGYLTLPWLLCFPLIFVNFYLVHHCDKGEYISIAADQRPPDPRDWDVESESLESDGKHDVDNFGREWDIINGEGPNENEETGISQVSGNTHNYGAIKL